MDTKRESYRTTNLFELGASLAAIRRELGLTQEQAADAIGAHRPYVTKLERGLATEQMIRTFLLLREYGYELHLIPQEPCSG